MGSFTARARDQSNADHSDADHGDAQGPTTDASQVAPTSTAPATDASPATATSTAAHAREPHRPAWPTHARRPGWLEAGVGVGLLGVGSAVPLLRKPSAPRWTGGILMDDWVRGGLQLSAPQRAHVATTSDILLYSATAAPLIDLGIELLAGRVDGDLALRILLYSATAAPLIDLGIELLAGRVDGDLALRILLVELQSFGVTGFLAGVSKVVAARERPYGLRCASDPSVPGCDSWERYVSFFSGHTSLTFTAAGLSCVMHRNLHLYGRSSLDNTACGLALGAATVTGVLRVVADQHWTSDVLVGATVGLLSGWLLPYLLYFHDAADADADDDDDSSTTRHASALPSPGLTSGVLSPWADPMGAGLSYSALF